jgi:hypothetical protein
MKIDPYNLPGDPATLASEIGLKAGKILGRNKVGKHFKLTIGDYLFKLERREDTIEHQSQLDGICIIHTSV